MDAHGAASSASTEPGLLIGLDAQPLHEAVQPAEEVHDAHHFEDRFVIESELLQRRSVDLHSIVTGVHRRDRNGADLLGQPGFHFALHLVNLF